MTLQSSSSLQHPFTPCPETPNCVIESHTFNVNSKSLYQSVLMLMNDLSTHELHPNEDNLSINSVFKIPIFGFKDDLEIAIQEESGERSLLFIKSSSRTGYSDLGVNQRRINRIIKKLNKKLS